MQIALRFRPQARSLLFLGIALLIVSSLPVHPANAIIVPQTVDNRLEQFALGTLQRTSLSALDVAADNRDEPGAVQLLPVGELKPWVQTSFNLPKKLTDLNAVTIGTHIFVIGGITGVGTTRGPTSDVWSATIDPTTGAPVSQVGATNWFTETKLPAVVASDDFPTPIAGRSGAAVTAVATGPDSGYIYVIGGSVKPNPTTTVSSYAVNIGTVSNGHITSWASGPKIPDAIGFGIALGLQNASAVSLKAANGKTHVYLIGGLARFEDAGEIHEEGSQQVYYAEVGSGGQLVRPSGGTGTDPVWRTLAPIPVPNDLDSKGLWDATAVADRIVIPNDTGGENVGYMLYVMGGQYQSSLAPIQREDIYSAEVYRAVFQSNGTIAWQADTPAPTLPETRIGFSGVHFGGALYVAGGQPPDADVGPQRKVLTTLIEDDFTLARLGTSSNFQSSDDTLPVPRIDHATVVVRATPTPQSTNPAYVYVIAGRGRTDDIDTTDNDGSDTVIMGRIGTASDTETPSFAKQGWFYSSVYAINFNGATVQQISWSTIVTRPSDIKLEYRASTDSDCNNPVTLNAKLFEVVDSTDVGVDTDGFFSKPGIGIVNEKSLGTPPAARCFQYRARISNASAGLTTSPSLLNVNIRVQIPGNPDLRVLTLQAAQDAQQRLTGLNVDIWNHSDRAGEPTQPADAEEPGGSFFVDLFIFGPGQTDVPPVIPFATIPPGDKACVDIPKSQMGIDAVLTITQWYTATDNTCHTVPQDILRFFTKPGKYIVYVAVDTGCPQRPYACVNEGSTGGEGFASNVKRIEFTLPNIPGGPIRYVSRVPIIKRAP
jgi:hypothetical protein